MKTKPSSLEGLNLLDLTPVRVAEWVDEGEIVVISRPEAPKPWQAPLAWLSATATAKKLRLDEIGSHVWRAMDGGTPVAEIARKLSETFGDQVEPVAERLGTLVRTMHHEGLIAYRGIDDAQPPPAR